VGALRLGQAVRLFHAECGAWFQASTDADKAGVDGKHSPFLKKAAGGDATAAAAHSVKQLWAFERRTRQQGGYCTW
jgi:hypothetical protein